MKSKAEITRKLRQNSTKAEHVFWQKVRNRQLGCKFYRQLPVGRYIADFACPELKLLVEIDGGQHAENAKDEVRTAALQRFGYHVVRYWNNEVLSNTDGVLARLSEIVSARKTGKAVS